MRILNRFINKKVSYSSVAVLMFSVVNSQNAGRITNINNNIVVILLDDVGWMDFGCYGSKFYETPNIDSLSAMGVQFTNCYACPQSSPSRFSMITGINPAKKGLTRAIIPSDHITKNPSATNWDDNKELYLATPRILDELPENIKTLPEYLKSAGYSTAMFGKWHLGSMKNNPPTKHGFDVYFGDSEGGPKSYFSPYGLEYLTDGPIGEHLDDRLTSESINYLENHLKTNKEKPFFMYLNFYSTHEPWQAKPQLVDYFKSKSDIRNQQRNPFYAAMMSTIDANIGRVKDFLEKHDLLKNTIVILTSDNGGVTTMYGNYRDNPGFDRGYFPSGTTITSNEPLRGGKSTVYEGGIRVPAIVLMPCGLKNVKNNTQAAIWDWTPTILDALNFKIDKNSEIDGESLLQTIKTGEMQVRKPVFMHFPHYQIGYSDNPAKTNFINYPCTAIRKGDWKLIYSFETYPELYNLSTDVREEYNVADKYSNIVKELSEEILQWLKLNGANLPLRNANYNQKFK